MKIKNISYTVIDEAHVNVSFDVYRDNGQLLLEIRDRGFVVTANTIEKAKAEIKQSIRNIRDTYQTVKASKVIPAMDELAALSEVDIEA